MKITSEAIFEAVQIAEREGLVRIEVSKGWTKARQVVHMGGRLSASIREQIERELPELRYWKAGRTPQNSGTEGYICEKDGVGLAFPLGDQDDH